MTAIILSGHVLIIENNKVLLVKHGDKASHISDTYGIPGGRPEDNETLIQAASRELKEETGLIVSTKFLEPFLNNTYTADILRKNGLTNKFKMTIYITKQYQGTLRKSAETTPEWIAIDQLDNYNLLPNVSQAVSAASSYLDS